MVFGVRELIFSYEKGFQFQVQLLLYTHPQVPLMVQLMKIWVAVYNYGLINEGVGVFGSLEDARLGLREYTGFN